MIFFTSYVPILYVEYMYFKSGFSAINIDFTN